MRILLLSDFFYPHISGGAIARFKFAEEAVKRGNKVVVFTPMRGGYEKREDIKGIEIRRPFRNKPEGMVPDHPIALFTRFFYSILFFFKLSRWLKRKKVDHIQTTEHIFHPIGKLLGKIFEIPVLSFVGYTPSLSGDESFFERLIFKHFLGDKVLCRSEGVKDKIERLSDSRVKVVHGVINRDSIERILDQVDVREKRKKLGFDGDDIVLTMVGRLTPVKNIERGIEILSELPERYKLLIVGDGPEREMIEKKVASLGLREKVIMLGRVGHEEAIKIMAASDMIMLTSKAEAYPTVVFEALALGKKVVATPVGILKEISEENLFVDITQNFPTIIGNMDFGKRNTQIDENMISRYGMERYTEETLDFMRENHG
ncbi:MAG: glycosyltransferase [Candidatus Thermoplasmatota archaeon]|nr:glycosyltransferase [Candidatus Thermoplasmatota archaeon]MBS3790058.1 glycosyltransferase [Candidatus Thermoplasmatota archaeon]